ncbi:hypothetical protein HH303_19885, partial [Rhodospirillaceae bacterium KN72]
MAATVDEDDLSDGTDGSQGTSVSGDIGFDSGDLITIDYGADGPAAGAPTGLGFGDMDFTVSGPSGLTSQGDAITYSYDEGTDTLTATAGGREVFTVQLNGDGTFTFDLKDSIDHPDGSGENYSDLTFSVTGVPNAAALASTDYDGDEVYNLDGMTVEQDFQVRVTDDVPTIENNQGDVGTAATGSVDEDDLSDGTSPDSGALTTGGDLGLAGGRELVSIDYGADGAAAGAPTALEYSDMDWTVDGPAGLLSNGDAVTYTQVGNVMTATADAGGTDERPVFTVTLNGDGTYTFELLDQIDHVDANGENVGTLNFSLSGTPSSDVVDAVSDYDDDAASGLAGQTITQSFGVDVTDDVPEAVLTTDGMTAADVASVDEDDLSDGTSPDAGALSASGDLGFGSGDLIAIDYGADGPEAGAPTGLGVDDLDFTVAGPAGLTSLGEPVGYTYDPVTDTLTATADGRDVFTVTLDGNGGYTFTLLDTLDHPTATAEDIMQLGFTVTGVPNADALAATDYDGDAIDGLSGLSVTQNFYVNVTDDVPSAVDDDGGATGQGGTLSGGNVLTNDTEGADTDGSGLEVVSFTYTDDNGQDHTGTVGQPLDTDYGTFTLNSDGSWTFTADDTVDFGGANSVTENITYTIEDADGDQSTADLEFDVTKGPSITVYDPPSGDPNLGADGAFVDEDDLTAAQGDSEVGTDGTGASEVSGTIDIEPGAAGFGSLTIDASPALDAMNLSSDGTPLVYTQSPDGQTLTATAGVGGAVVFTAALTGDEANGFGWTFDLVGNLDHPAGQDENVLENLEFTVTLTDGEGTEVSGAFTVDVIDDVPV